MKIWLYLLCATPKSLSTASRGVTSFTPTQKTTTGSKIITKTTTSLIRSSPTILPLYTTSNLSTLSASNFEASSRTQKELIDNASLMLLIVSGAMLLILCIQLLLINLLRCKLRRHYNQCVEEIKKLVKQMYGSNLELSTDKAGAPDNIVITATPNAQSTMVTLTLGTGAAVNPPIRSVMKEAMKKLKTLTISLNDKTAGLHGLQKKGDANLADNLADTLEKRPAKERVMLGSKEELKSGKKQKFVIPLQGADKNEVVDKNEKKDKGEELLHSPEAKVKSQKQKLLPSTPVEPSAVKKDEHYFSVRKENPELVPEQKSQKQKVPPPAPVGPNTPKKDEHYFSVRKEKPEVAAPEQKFRKEKIPTPAPVGSSPMKEEHYFSVRKEKPEVAVPEQKSHKHKLPPPTRPEPNEQKKEEDFFSLPKART